MELDKAFHQAAKAAEKAVAIAMTKYQDGNVVDEDDLTGVLIGRLDAAFDQNYGGIKWSSSIFRHRKGIAAEEKAVGADLLIHVTLETAQLRYSKGVLIQAKRIEPAESMNKSEHEDLLAQCKKMLEITPASFVFDYAKSGMRCASATKVSGSSSRELYQVCNLTPYRFFLELFRCTTGDPNIPSSKSAIIEGLASNVLHLKGTSESGIQGAED